MSYCGIEHPDLSGVHCNRPGVGSKANHQNHSGPHENEYVDWPNETYVQPEPRKKGESKNKGKLEVMAARTRKNKQESAEEPRRHFIPTESDARGRVALYLLKYLNEWIYLNELEHETIGGSAAQSKVQELINFGWPIMMGTAKSEPLRYKLTRDPRKPLWQITTSSTSPSVVES